MQDINALSVCWTTAVFEAAVILFFQKWESYDDDIIASVLSLFRKSWTGNSLTSKWAKCHSPNDVMNNNGLESTNRVIKDEVTERQLLPVIDFFNKIMAWIQTRSEKKNPIDINYAPFVKNHSMTNTCWEDAYRWTKDQRFQKWRRVADDTYLVTDKEVKSDLTDSRASRLIDKINNVTFTSFDDFTSCTNNIFVLNVDQSRDEGYSCTCKQNAKEFSCLHSVGIAIIRGTLVPPRRAMVTLEERWEESQWQHQLGSINHLKSIHLLHIPNKMHVSSLASSNPNC